VQLSVLSLLFVVAIGQGVFVCVYLLSARQREMWLANGLLAALIAVFVVMITHAIFSVQHLFGAYSHVARAIAILPLLVGPLLLQYLRSMLHGASLSRRSVLHLLPFGVALLVWAPSYLQSWQIPHTAFVSDAALPLYISVFALIKALHVCAYLFASYRLVARTEVEQPGQLLIPGLRRLTFWLGAGLASDAALFALEYFFPSMPVWSDAWGALVLSVFIYGLTLLSMRLPLGYRPQSLAAAPAGPAVQSASLLTPAEQARFLQALAASMEQDHAYRDGELSLAGLAARLALSAHELSQLINQNCGVNFQEYLNGFRVDALKAAMRDPDHAQASILDLALGAGFNSKSAMNRAFKKHTGMTPSEFRRPATA
jgi:AraC-like DNA-binding protein